MCPSEPTVGGRARFTVHDLGVAYRTPGGHVPVVSGVTLEARPGRILGVAGESGSGKTTAVLAAIGYFSGQAVRLGGEARLGELSIFDLGPEERRRFWARRVSYVAQDAAGSLNPAFRIGAQLREVLEVNAGLPRILSAERARGLLAAVRLPDPVSMLRRYPHQCSGGQLQRIAIAMAIAAEPDVVIFDEPTTGLDVTTQAEVVAMLTDLIHDRAIAAIYISHDLALLGAVSDDLTVFYAGEVVESGPTGDVLRAPRHPYTRALLDALPSAHRATSPVGLPGLPPGQVVSGACAFAPRCGWVVDACHTRRPNLLPLGDRGRSVRCFRASELEQVISIARQSAGGEHLHAAGQPDGPGNDSCGQRRDQPVLAIEDLWCSYGRGPARFTAVQGASLDIAAGEVVALVGESGSGKSTLGRAIVGLIRAECGVIRFAGLPLDPSGRRSREHCRAIQIIFQNPDSSLNPRHTVTQLIGRALEVFRPDIARADRPAAVAAALSEVRLDPSLRNRYPHQLSGGQKQRVAIARAFVTQPRVVICDEIVSGQDVSVQAAMLDLVRAMQERHSTALLFISHDLVVVRSIAQRVYVIQRGQIVESGPTERLFEHPQHGYTRSLLASVLEPDIAGASASMLVDSAASSG